MRGAWQCPQHEVTTSRPVATTLARCLGERRTPGPCARSESNGARSTIESAADRPARRAAAGDARPGRRHQQAASAHTNADERDVRQALGHAHQLPDVRRQNRVKVSVDGAGVADTTFGSSYSQTFAFADSTVAHSWTVKVTGVGRPGRQKGWTLHQERHVDAVRAAGRLPGAARHPAARRPSCTPPHDDTRSARCAGRRTASTRPITVEKQKRTRDLLVGRRLVGARARGAEWTTYETYTVPTTSEDCPGTEVTADGTDVHAAELHRRTPPHLRRRRGLPLGRRASRRAARVLDAVAENGYVLVGQTHYGPYDLTSWSAAEKIKHGCVGELVTPRSTSRRPVTPTGRSTSRPAR